MHPVSFVYFGEDQKAITKLEEYVENCRQMGLKVKYEAISFDGQEKEIPKKNSRTIN